MLQRCLLAVGYSSRHPEQCTILTLDHRHCCGMMAHWHQNWNHQHWSYLLFDPESSASRDNCNWLVRVFCHFAERLEDFYVQYVGGINKHDDQSGRSWPWTYHRISHETRTNGYSYGASLPTCGHVVLATMTGLMQYPTATEHLWTDINTGSSSSYQLHPALRRWGKTLSPQNMKKGMVFCWCDLQSMPA